MLKALEKMQRTGADGWPFNRAERRRVVGIFASWFLASYRYREKEGKCGGSRDWVD